MSPSATRRVQRVAREWPIVHLEALVPEWTTGLTIGGLVRHPRRFQLADLEGLGAEEHAVDFHCVWGWSKPAVVWFGVRLGAVLDLVGAEPGRDRHVTIAAASGAYSACLPIGDAARGVLAWGRDGRALLGEHGGPLRYLPPADHWAYKGVKWASDVTVVDGFRPGFWESRVADPIGRIPRDEIELP